MDLSKSLILTEWKQLYKTISFGIIFFLLLEKKIINPNFSFLFSRLWEEAMGKEQFCWKACIFITF